MLCDRPARTCLITFNFCFLVIGLTLTLIGIWTRFDPNFANIWSQLGTEISAKNINSLWFLLILSGGCTGLIGVIGFFGAKLKSRRLLTLYLALIITILVVEQVAIYFAISFQTRVKSDLSHSLNTTVHSAIDGKKLSVEALDNIQKLFMCCGANGPHDFGQNITLVSCYPDENPDNKPYKHGCSEVMLGWIKDRYPVITTLLLFVIIFEIFTIVCAILVCARPRQMEAYDLF